MTVTDCTVLGISNKFKPDKIQAWTQKVGTKAHPLLRCCWPVTVAEKGESVFFMDVISDPRMATQIIFYEIKYKQANQNYRWRFWEKLRKEVNVIKIQCTNFSKN